MKGNKAIPTLEGEDAERFITNMREAEKMNNIELNGEKFQAIPSTEKIIMACVDCAFDTNEKMCDKLECSSFEREDCKDVIWVKV